MRQFYEQWEPTINKSTATTLNSSVTTDEIEIDTLLCTVPTALAVDFKWTNF